MKFQLVLQLPKNTLKNFDELVSIEDHLISELGNAVVVDGHDLGKEEANLFILTNDPEATFLKAREALNSKYIKNMKAAFREIKGENYKPIWPLGLKVFILN